jgi:hypothetical protein
VIGAGCLKKLLDVVGGLPHLTLEITLNSGDEPLVGVANILVVVTLITTGGDRDSLGPPLQPPFVTFGTPLHALVSCLGWRSLTATGGRFPAALNKNGSDRLLARGVPGGDVEELLCGLWLVTAELMHDGSTVRAGQES